MTRSLPEHELRRRAALRALRDLRKRLFRLKADYPVFYYNLVVNRAGIREGIFYDTLGEIEHVLIKLGDQHATRTTKENA